jgi:hypothetical protein
VIVEGMYESKTGNPVKADLLIPAGKTEQANPPAKTK